MTVRIHSSGNRKYKKVSSEPHTHTHTHTYAQRLNNKLSFNLRLLLRYLYAILDLLKRNKLKAILVSLVAIALVLTISVGNRSSVSGNDSRLGTSNKAQYMVGQSDQYNKDEFYGGYDNNNDDDDDYYYYYYEYDDLSDFDLSDYDLDELYQQGLLISAQDTEVYDNTDSDDNVNVDNDLYEDIFSKDKDIKINRNITIDELNRRKEEEISQKVAKRVKAMKDAWLKSVTSNDKKKNPEIPFEDTLEGSTAESFARHGFRPKGALVMYVSDSDIHDIIKTIESVQSHFNDWVQYPWVLISVDGREFNDTEWLGKLTEFNVFDATTTNNNNNTSTSTSNNDGKTKIVLQTVSDQFWGVPEWIDPGKWAQARNRLRLEPHIESTEYKIWTRYFTGFLPLESFMSKYDWMWYIKPGTELFCDVDYDVFRFLQDSEKLVGLSGSFKVENLPSFEYGKYYKLLTDKYKDIIRRDNFESFLLEKGSDDKDKKFDKCELLVEGFSISNLNFWRSKVYQKYFEFIDREGTIFHNAWSINKVQTLAITLLMDQKSFQFLDNLGFQNEDYFNCPIDDTVYRAYHCECDQGNDMTFVDNTCSRKFYDILHLSFPDNWNRHTNYLRELKLKE